MFNPVTQFGTTSGFGALGFSLSSLVIQLITFILAYLVLRKWAFGPILKVLRERRETIEKGVALGLEMQKEKAALEEQVSKDLHEARRQADTILAEAQDAARTAARESEEKARAKADIIVAEGHERAEQEVARERKELEKEFVGLISDATETIISEKVDAKKDAVLIDRALKGQRA